MSLSSICTSPAFPLMSLGAPTVILLSLRRSTSGSLPLLLVICCGIALSVKCQVFFRFCLMYCIGKNEPPHPRSHPLGILVIVHEVWIITKSTNRVRTVSPGADTPPSSRDICVFIQLGLDAV